MQPVAHNNRRAIRRDERPEGVPIRTYAALGDTFTASWVSQPAERWADRLALALAADRPRFSYHNLAREGATSSVVIDQATAALRLQPDLVTVVFGVDDLLRWVRPDPDLYACRLITVFTALGEASPSRRILTATTAIDWASLRLTHQSTVNLEAAAAAFDQATRETAARFGVPCLELADRRGPSEPDSEFHPFAVGHAEIAAGFAELLEGAGVSTFG